MKYIGTLYMKLYESSQIHSCAERTTSLTYRQSVSVWNTSKLPHYLIGMKRQYFVWVMGASSAKACRDGDMSQRGRSGISKGSRRNFTSSFLSIVLKISQQLSSSPFIVILADLSKPTIVMRPSKRFVNQLGWEASTSITFWRSLQLKMLSQKQSFSSSMFFFCAVFSLNMIAVILLSPSMLYS